MSDTPLIEAIARALEQAHVDHVEAHNAALAKAGLWPDHRATPTRAALAQAALTAITEAGYAVVPVHPDLDTMLGMMNAANEADCGDLTITSARAALAYLISAAQGDGA